MATVVNTPSATSDSWVGTVIGVLVVGFLLILFFAYGLPMIRGAATGNQSGINVNLPDKVNVNTDQPSSQPTTPQ